MSTGEPVSAIVITYNEEANIARALASLRFASEIVVVDSHSTDKTVEIARTFTPHVVQHAWGGYVAQKEYAISLTSNEWVFWLDADEEVTPELEREIKGLDFGADGYSVPRLTRYLGRWIRHGGWYPDRAVRLFRKSRALFSNRLVHEGIRLQGPCGTLKHPLYHYTYRDIAHHLEKMNTFTSLAARQSATKGATASLPEATARAFVKWIKMYLLKRGFLDGAPGFAVAVLGSYYVFLKYAKLWELRRIQSVVSKDTPNA